ncbi:carboxypeptidase regulatory-like domain-containing protein [bacterium]|nr:carboxypeptidase regulatory-like domain-containing protein [bacterium]
MIYLKKIFLITALMTGFFCFCPATAEITVEPFGFALSVEEDAETEIELTLSNSGEDEAAFSIRYELISDEEERFLNPERDEPGEVIREYRIPYVHTIGLAWDPDNEWMWGFDWTERRLYAIDVEEGEIQVNVVLDQGCVGLFYWEGVIYGGGYNANRLIYRFDQEGDIINTIQLPISLADSHIGGNGQYIFTVAYERGGGEGDVHVFDMENLEQVAVIDCSEEIGVDVWGLEWISDHPRGQLWLCNPSRMFQYYVDDDWNAELVQEFNTVRAQPGHCGLAHDGENLWRGVYGVNDQNWYVIDDGVREFDMLTIEPEEGAVQGNESETVNITVNSEGYEAGVYNILISIELSEPQEERDDLEQSLIEISAVVTIGDPTFNLTGVVTAAANDAPIEGAAVSLDNYHIISFTDEEGAYIIESLPAGEYMITILATDFLTANREVSIEDEDVELNEALLYAEFTPSRDDFFMVLEDDMDYEIEFQVTNTGNGPLRWSVERNIPAVQDIVIWEVRSNVNAQEIVEDEMLNGVVCTWNRFYVSGGNNGDDVSKIYILNNDFEQVGEFDQFTEDRYGMRDLAYDGDLIWGAVEGSFYGFTEEGDLEVWIEAEADVEGRCIAWDPDSELLWTSDISTDIYGINRNGELIRTIENDDLRIYGLGYWEDDPDDYNLYVFCRGPDNIGISVYKVNLDNGDYMEVTYLDTGESRPGGMYICNHLDNYSWVLVGLVQNPDELTIWQLGTNYGWFRIAPEEGVIEPDESEDFVLTFDSTDLFVECVFVGELIFTHDGIGGKTILDVELYVVDNPCCNTRDIELLIGWNTVSTNIQPDDHYNIEGLLSALVRNHQLIMMKNDAGNFYRPENNYNDISGWFCHEGYQMLMSEAATLTLEGESVLKTDPIDLNEGWQLVSYYPRYEIEATDALVSIADNLIIAKDGYGNFYLPEWDGFCNMGNMRAGQGYFINVDEDCRLVYVTEEEEEQSPFNSPFTKGGAASGIFQSVYDHPGNLPVHHVTDNNMSLLVTCDGSLEGEIGVYATGELVGSGILQDGVCGIAVWGDGISTEKVDGAIPGEALEIKILTDNGIQDAAYSILTGELTYETNELAVIRLDGSIEVPMEFGIVSVYPNPFNSQMRVSYNLLETGIVDLAVYDISGRRVADLSSGRQVSGVHTVMFDGKDMPSGVYMLCLQSVGQNSIKKVMLIR